MTAPIFVPPKDGQRYMTVEEEFELIDIISEKWNADMRQILRPYIEKYCSARNVVMQKDFILKLSCCFSVHGLAKANALWIKDKDKGGKHLKSFFKEALRLFHEYHDELNKTEEDGREGD